MEKILKAISARPQSICSIDASTNSLAFAIFNGDKLQACGKIKFSGKNTFAKVIDAAKKTGKFLEHFKIDAIVIEHTVYLNSPKTMNDLAMVQGAIIGSASVPMVKTINPIAWQTSIGNGKLSKEDKLALRSRYPGKTESWYKAQEREIRKQKTINFVNINYDKNLSDNDVADAIGIGHYAIRNWEKLGD